MKYFVKFRRTVVVLLFVGTTSFSFAQLRQGAWLIGGTGNLAASKFYMQSFIETNAGYLIRPKIELGTAVSYAHLHLRNSDQSFNSNKIGISPYARFYLLRPAARLNIFTEASVQSTLLKHSSLAQNYFYFQSKISLGALYFIKPNFALEFKVSYEKEHQAAFNPNLTPFKSTIGLKIQLGGNK